MNYQVTHGDCLDWLPTVADASVDCVISDPPYPEIDRDYGRMTESAWMDMMQEVVRQSRRILKPTGSAVFILQPNSEKVGKMRLWLWEFMVWAGKEWGIVQDAYWWNIAAMPKGVAQFGLMRPSLKSCVWLGNPNCYRNQDAVLWGENKPSTTGGPDHNHRMYAAAGIRGGVTPFNVLPIKNNGADDNAGSYGHGAGTPLKLADWWARYICPPSGVVCDPFTGSGTMGIAALQNGCSFVGCEKMRHHYETACCRLQHAAAEQSTDPIKLTGSDGDTDDLPLFT